MKKNLFRKVLCFILSVTTLFGAVGVSASAASYKGDESTSATLEEMESLVGTLSYAEYLKTYSDVVNREGLGSISVDVTKFEGNGSIVSESDACTGSMSENPDAWAEFGDENKDTSVYLPATGSVTWQFKIDDNCVVVDIYVDRGKSSCCASRHAFECAAVCVQQVA
jgi:cytochrome c556